MADRFNADMGSGWRSNTADWSAGASGSQRASFGSEQDPSAEAGQEVLSSAPKGNPHSAAGFRRALMRTQRSGNKLKDQLPDKQSFSGPGYKKPSYFAQGARRHGMHIGAGSPATIPAETADSSWGGSE